MSEPNLRKLRYTIPKSLDGQTIEAFLREKGYSKKILSHLKDTVFPDASIHAYVPLGNEDKSHFLPPQEEGICHGIMLNGRHAYVPQRLRNGDTLEIYILDSEESENVPESPIPVEILYEDEDLQIINKPAGLPIHPSKSHYEDSLGNALCYYAHHSLKQEKFVFRAINRLDRDTSGLLICAKNMLSAGILGKAVWDRDIHREYLAVCKGNPVNEKVLSLRGVSLSTFPGEYSTSSKQPYRTTKLTKADALSERNASAKQQAASNSVNIAALSEELLSLRIEAPLLDQPDIAMTRSVDFERGIRAVSDMQLLRYDKEKNLSLLRLRLETGRTHQIRVHMKYLGHPLIGDFLYHPDYKYISRQALHSHALHFHHPITGEELHFQKELPEDMKKLFPEF